MAIPAGKGLAQGASTRTVMVDGHGIVYREIGPAHGMPIVALNHLGANLDDWDPRVVDGLAEDRRVILLGYRGVGRSEGRVRASIDEMALDAIAAIRALGLNRVDLFGLSMGGMVAQRLLALAPDFVDRLILISTGPAGGPGLVDMTRVMVGGSLRAALAFRDPKSSLFFTRSSAGRAAARAYSARLKERTSDRDGSVGPAVLRAQLAAVHAFGQLPLPDRSSLPGPVLLLHGADDLLVPPANAAVLTEVFPNASLTVFPEAGHGVVFQHHDEVIAAAGTLLRR